MKLNLEPKIEDPDGFYNQLICLHDGLSEEESLELQSRMILILANHIGDSEVLSEVMRIAREPFEK
jgi:hypothetical protein